MRIVQRHVETVVEDITKAATAANDLAVSFTGETKQVVENLKSSNDQFIQDFTSVTKDSSEQFKLAASDGAEAIKAAMSDAAGVMSDSLDNASQTLVSTGENLSQNSKALVDIKQQIHDTKGPYIREQLQDMIRQWFIECRDNSGTELKIQPKNL